MQTNNPPGATDATGFYEYSSSQAKLFSVLPGVPADGALEAASNFLDVARDCAYQGDANLSNAAAYLIEMAKAVVDSLVSGIDSMPNDAETAHVFERLTEFREKGVITIRPDAYIAERDEAERFLDWAAEQARGGAN